MQEHIFYCFASALIALVAAVILNPRLVKLSYNKNLTDQPNHRKLQKHPVPILGGMSVFLGTTLAILFLNCWLNIQELYMITVCLMTMFFIGFLDDMLDLGARTKFAFQIGVTLLLWYSGFKISTLMGLFGIYDLPNWASLILSLLASVGLMNAINMIDGVDGLSSGFGIGSSIICALYFFIHYDFLFAAFASIFIGSLIPFFFCNVFSRKYKMFIGDSGSLVMGTVAYIFVCRIIQLPELFDVDRYKIAMTLAIYAIPISDTLRVMTMRMLHKHSPFVADRTHLHHLFVDLKFPHVGITLVELLMATVIFWCGWALGTQLQLSITTQCIYTILVAALVSWGTYGSLSYIRDYKERRFEIFGKYVIRKTQWLIIFRQHVRMIIDRK